MNVSTCISQRLSRSGSKSVVAAGNICGYISRRTKFSCHESHPILQASSFQHRFKDWQELKRHKLTPSTFSMAVGFWPKQRYHLWLEKVGATKPFTGNLTTCWNNIKEEEALESYKLSTGCSVSFPKFQVYGKNPDDEWLAASPDGVVERLVDGEPSLGVLEIKCPYFDGDAKKAIPWSSIPFTCIPQAQGLMEIMDLDWMDFYVWTPRGSRLFRMDRDKQYWNVLKTALSDFWWQHVQPARELCDKSVITDPHFQLRAFRPSPRHELCKYLADKSKLLARKSRLVDREIYGKCYTGL